MERIIAAVVVLCLGVAGRAQVGGTPPALPPEMAAIMEQVSSGKLSPEEAEAAIREAGRKQQAAMMAKVTQGGGTIDIADGTGKIEFPKWPEIDTYDKAYRHTDAFKKWHEAWVKAIGSLGVNKGYTDEVGKWTLFWGARDTLEGITGKMSTDLTTKNAPIMDRFTKEHYQLYDDYTKAVTKQTEKHEEELHELGERQNSEWHFSALGNISPEAKAMAARHKKESDQMVARHREEDKQLQIQYYQKEIDQARSAFSELFANWKRFRQQVEYECQDYYDVCTGWIREIPAAHYEENRAMNWGRASAIWGQMVSLGASHPAYGGLPFIWTPAGPLSREELERMFLDAGPPPAGVPRSRIPSTDSYDDPLSPLVPADPEDPFSPLTPLEPGAPFKGRADNPLPPLVPAARH